jgi:hypothetical protein
MRSTILFVEPLQRARTDCSFFKHEHGSEDSLVIENLKFPSKWTPWQGGHRPVGCFATLLPYG